MRLRLSLNRLLYVLGCLFLAGSLFLASCLFLPGTLAEAQSGPPATLTAQGTAPAPNPAPSPEPAAPQGQVIIQSHGDPPARDGAGGTVVPEAQAESPVVGEGAQADVNDAERSSLLVTSYDFDLRLAPARGALSMRAKVTVHNTGTAPLKQIPLQISSTLHWDSATLLGGGQRTALPLAQHTLDTDADHTGAENEAILPLPTPLAPGAAVALDLFYSGPVPASGSRLARLGATGGQQADTDWDAISPSWTALRGFGNVLWYPVAAPQVFLAEGNTLFQAVGQTRLAQRDARIHLRLSVEYIGDPPAAAYFCGRRQPLKAISDDPDAPTAASGGVATADFPAEALGFRTPSLFLIGRPELLLGGSDDDPSAPAGEGATSSSSSSSSSVALPMPDGLPVPQRRTAASTASAPAPASATSFLAVATDEPVAAAGLMVSAAQVVPLLTEWLGPQPLSALTVIDHNGQPFQDGPLLVAPVSILETSPQQRALLGSLTHAWVQTGQPWMDDGLAQFFTLLWTERTGGRDAAVSELAASMEPVALAEPDFTPGADRQAGAATTAVPSTQSPSSQALASQPLASQPLIAATAEVVYRNKAGAVWWMLRDLAGEGPLRAALGAWRTQAASPDPPAVQAVAFEHLLEKLSGKDLGWFFADWVLHDRGLPDLTLVDVQTSQTPAGVGHSNGWLVAITVRNDGGATADVPLIVRSGTFSTTQRLRIPGNTGVTQRVLVEAPPTEVLLNDGGVPELRSAVHTRALSLHAQ